MLAAAGIPDPDSARQADLHGATGRRCLRPRAELALQHVLHHGRHLLFWATADKFRKAGMLGRHKAFPFKNKLLSLDSTIISLCLKVFPWDSCRRANGGVKGSSPMSLLSQTTTRKASQSH
jgi:hypothetical protein